MSHLPPSVKRQDDAAILILTGLGFLLGFLPALILGWELLSPWGSFANHWPSFFKAGKEFLFHRSFSTLNDYWEYIETHQLQWHLYCHIGIPALLGSLLAYGGFRLAWVPGGRDGYRHVKGPKLYQHKLANQHAKKYFKTQLKTKGAIAGLALLNTNVLITRASEVGSILCVGGQGSGKTSFILPLMKQTFERPQTRNFVFDEKKEFTRQFFDPSNTVLIAPWDARSMQWDIQRDCRSLVEAQMIAECLIPDSDDPLWSNGARIIFTGMLLVLIQEKNQWGWQELAQMLTRDEKLLFDEFEAIYPLAARFIHDSSKTTQSFFAQILGHLGWIITLAEAWPNSYDNGFSITEWATSEAPDKRNLIVQGDPRYKTIGAPITSAFVTLMTTAVLAQNTDLKKEIFLYLDELSALPPTPALLDWAKLSRSKGGRTVAGVQSVSMLNDLYGIDGTDSLLNLFHHFVSMRLGAAGKSAEYTAAIFGKRQVEYKHTSGQGESASTQWQRDEINLVEPEDITQLPDPSVKGGVHGFLTIPGRNAVYQLRWNIPEYPNIAPEYQAADWLSNSRKSTPPETPTPEPSISKREQLKRKRELAHDGT